MFPSGKIFKCIPSAAAYKHWNYTSSYGVLRGLITEGAYNWNGKRASKQAIPMLIKIRFSFRLFYRLRFNALGGGGVKYPQKVGGGGGLLSDVIFCLQADGPITGARGGGACQWGVV